MAKIYENYFNPKSVADRYLKGRPQYHSFVIGKIKETLEIDNKFSSVLDIGCGTGFSSIVLKEIAENVIGIDLSEEMLRLAVKENKVEYILSSAEFLPFEKDKFDLITISQAIHWIDREMFFAEADRVLKSKSFIVVYDNYFTGQIDGTLEFNDWYRERFLQNFPLPPRDRRKFETESENPKDFVLIKEEWHENLIDFSKEELIDFLLTITNVVNHIENGSQSIQEVSKWLKTELKLFFPENKKQPFIFNAPIWYLNQIRNF